MFKNLRLWANIMIGMLFAILLVVGGLLYNGLNNLEEVIAEAERHALNQHAESLLTNISAETRLAEAMSSLLANIPTIQEHFAAGDRDWLRDQLLATYKIGEKSYGFEQFQFHTPPATSFLRVHKPEKFGADLSSFRHTVVNTNKNKVNTTGLEVGVAGLGARGVVPVFLGNQHLGSLEFGMSFGQSFFDSFKAKNSVDAALFIARDDKFEPFASTLAEVAKATPLFSAHELKLALQGKTQYATRLVNGMPMAIFARQVMDYSNHPLGVVEIAMDRSNYEAALQSAKNQSWMIALLALLVGLVIAIISSRTLGRRLNELAVGVNRVAEGNLAQPIPISGLDEIAELATTIDAMRKALHQLVSEVQVNANAVSDEAEEIASAVESQAATATETSASVAEITSTMEELSASSSQIAEYSEKVVSIANLTLEESRSGSQAMQSINQKMVEIKEENRLSLGEIIQLGSKSKEISKVMVIINNIADQTKLIAFNAALEASSAGEAGQRFSVVAAEIRRLADSVTESTGEIERKVNEIQDSISRLVITSEKGASGIDEGVNISSDTANRLNQLVDAASRTTRSAEQISLSTQQQKSASDQVLIALREIVIASGNTTQAIEQVQGVAQRMTSLSSKLNAHVGRFNLDNEPLPSKIIYRGSLN
ncbi:MAG: methyl-accepting chemotaxis protein [Gammaproteobacteria bacterium]|nr:methyl-accepting chemotaxis protein [Gammaproteobacteria bacterium]